MVIIAILMWLALTIPACFILDHKHRGAGSYILAVFFPPIGLIAALCLNKLPIDPREKDTRSTLFMAFVVMVSTILYAMLIAHVQDPFPDIDPTSTPISVALISRIVLTVPACFILDHKHRGSGYYVLAGFFPLMGLIVALCLKKLTAEDVPLRKKSSMSTSVKVLIAVALGMLCAILTFLVQDTLPDSVLPFMRALIIWIVITVPACFILSNKHRGAGYYILAVLFPLIGLIVALCLKKLLPAEELPKIQANDLDITKENKQQ